MSQTTHGVQNLEQALALLRKARFVYVHVKAPGYIIGNAEEYVPNCFTACIKIDKKEAAKMLTDMFAYNKRERVLSISESTSVGHNRWDSRKETMVQGKDYTSIFIG